MESLLEVHGRPLGVPQSNLGQLHASTRPAGLAFWALFLLFRCTHFSLPHLLPVPWENRSHRSTPPVSSLPTWAVLPLLFPPATRRLEIRGPLPSHPQPTPSPDPTGGHFFPFFCKQVLSSPSSQGCSLPPILNLYLSLALRGFVPRLQGWIFHRPAGTARGFCDPP